MKMEMTERDKKLLIFLTLFLLVVCIGYWGIRPLLKDIGKYNDQIEEAQSEQDITQMKISMLPMMERENEEYEEDILTARNNFYPMMTSDEIDKMFTGMALDYNLESKELVISMPTEECVLNPYQYSKKALETDEEAEEDTSEEEDLLSSSSAASDDEDTELLFGDEDEVSTGIYMAEVTMRLEGDEAMLQKLINDLSVSDNKHLLKSYRWGESTSSNLVFDGGEYQMDVSHTKNNTMIIDIYMCAE